MPRQIPRRRNPPARPLHPAPARAGTLPTTAKLIDMNELQIVSIVVSGVCVIITTCLAWIMIYRVNRTEVSFTGTPVDKKEFDRHVHANAEEHVRIFSKIGGVERGSASLVSEKEKAAAETRHKMHESIKDTGERVARLETQTDMIDRRITGMDGKLDRIRDLIK